MSVVPVIQRGTMYPRDKTTAPYPFTSVSFMEIAGLEVGGGPILPPDQAPIPDPPLTIWGGGNEPFPTPPINLLPQPPFPPINPPTPPEKPHEGWNWKPSTPDNPTAGWYYLYVPGEGTAEPKR